MATPIFTAGAALADAVAKPSPRREAIRVIRQALRKQESTDDEVDEALEALVELAKD